MCVNNEDVVEEENPDGPRAINEPPYSVHKGATLVGIVIVSGIAVFMSAFTVSLYFPELTEVARDLNVSQEKINLTVTMYFIVQGFTPMLWSSLADSLGRRPIYMATYTIFLIANIAICFTKSYGSLMALRMLQATGSAASVAIGTGTVADVVDREHRGTYLGIVASMSTIAPSIGPVLSGVLSVSSYGWRTIFFFVLAIGFVEWLLLVLWMPETGRNIVGNGSVAPTKWYSKSVVAMITRKQWPKELEARSTLSPPRPVRNPLRVLAIAFQKDVLAVLSATGILYAIYSGITVGASSNLSDVYKLSTLKVGLCFLPLGCGSAIGSIVSGRLIDRDYKAAVKSLGYTSYENDAFPLERVRLRKLVFYAFPFFGAMMTYGWTLRSSITLAVPLIMMFLVGFGFMSVFTAVQVLITDLYPNQSVSVNAMNNLIRCYLAAASASLVDVLKTRIGIPWTYTTLACIFFAIIPLILVELVWGPKWRKARNKQDRENERRRLAAIQDDKPESTEIPEANEINAGADDTKEEKA